jgi:hypothetical protein
MVPSTQREPFLKRKEWFCPHRENLRRKEWFCPHRENRSLGEKNSTVHTERTIP